MRSITRCDDIVRRSLVTVSAMPDDSQASSRSALTLVKSSTAIDGSAAGAGCGAHLVTGGGGAGDGVAVVHGGDEPVAAPGHGLHERRARGVVSKRLTKLGDRLRERVVGHGDVGPERVEELVLRDEHRGACDEIDQEVEDLWRQRTRGPRAGAV